MSAQPLPLASAAERPSVRCTHCKLNQFVATSQSCRRCHKPLFLPVVPEPETQTKSSVEAEQEIGLDAVTVGANVAQLRQMRGLSQRQLAKRLGCPRTFISKIENKKCMPTMTTIARLAAGLNVPAVTLMMTPHDREAAMLAKWFREDEVLLAIASATADLSTRQRQQLLVMVQIFARDRRPKGSARQIKEGA